MKYLIKIVCVITVMGLVISCNKKKFTDLNIDSQANNTLDLNFIFTTAQLGAASGGSAGDDRYIDWRTNIGMCAYAIQQLANAGGGIAPGDKYTENNETNAAPWDFIYGDQLKNLTTVIKESDAGGYAEGQNKNLRQAARILKAFLFERLTDYYGSIPYTEALQASNIPFPKYDKQKDIYADLLKELDEATAALGTADPNDGFADADLYYKGDISKWKKWGYSLMLRTAMRISNVDAATANTYVAKAVAGGVFTSNDDNVIVPMAITPSQWTDQNGISRAFYPGDGGQPTYMSKTLIDWLKGTNVDTTADDDPRLMIFTAGKGSWTASGFTATDANPLTQEGMPNGKDASQLPNQDASYSKINPKLLDLDEPYMLMNYGEVELMLAEASERGIGGLTAATAATHYKAGVKASMQMYTIYDASFAVSDAKVTAYLAVYPYVSGNTGLRMTGEQYWANHYLNWWEAWSNWRRTEYPVLTPVNYPGNLTNGTIPERLRYPSTEVAANSNAASGTKDDYVTKLWWAGGPE